MARCSAERDFEVGVSQQSLVAEGIILVIEQRGDGVPSLIGGLIGDFITALGAPVGHALSAAVAAGLADFEKRKEEELRKLLLEELQAGEKTVVDVALQDHLFAIWLWMRHAALTGVAREKLRIMARVLNGQLQE